MTALLVPLQAVRNAVQQSERMGMPETRQDVIQRVLEDLRDPRHPQHSNNQKARPQ